MCGRRHNLGLPWFPETKTQLQYLWKKTYPRVLNYNFLSFTNSPFLYCLHGLALHAIIIQRRTKLAQILHSNTMTVSNTRLLPKSHLYIKSRTRPLNCIPYLILLLSFSHFQYIAELDSIETHCSGIPNFKNCWSEPSLITLSSYTKS